MHTLVGALLGSGLGAVLGAALAMLLLGRQQTDARGRRQGEAAGTARAEADAEALERGRLALRGVGMGTWEWHVGTGRMRWSTGLEAALDLGTGTLGTTLPEYLRSVDPADRDELLVLLAGAAATGSDLSSQHRLVDGRGTTVPVQLLGRVAHDADGQPAWISGVVMDARSPGNLSRTRESGRVDPLTGVATRVALVDEVHARLSDPSQDDLAGLLLVDVRHVSDVNDALGHETGDRFLTAVAARLRAMVRDTDIVARVGGCQFAVLPSGISSPDGFGGIATALLAAMEAPVEVGDSELYAVLNLGIAVAEPGISAAGMLQRADIAARQARSVPGTWRIYSDADESDRCRRLTLVGALKQALRHGDLQVHYQPKFDLASSRMIGSEALLRWPHPDGDIGPAEFLPLAEQAGLMRNVTAFVLATALRQCRSWSEQGYRLPVAVNVSPECLADPAFADTVARELAAHGVEPELLILEITETKLASSLLGSSGERLTGLRRLGVRLAIDDFGTGYSSLAYLKELPVQEIKIDRGFVRDLARDSRDRAVVAAALTLGNAFSMTVVAEGIETPEVADLLAELGCTVGQGFGLARPAPAEEITRRMRAERMADASRHGVSAR